MIYYFDLGEEENNDTRLSLLLKLMLLPRGEARRGNIRTCLDTTCVYRAVVRDTSGGQRGEMRERDG